jgi:hypothetical protein
MDGNALHTRANDLDPFLILDNTRRFAAAKTQAVVARVPQGCSIRVDIRLEPSRGLDLSQAMPACVPRQGSGTRGTGTLGLPHGLADKLAKADGRVSDWLAADEANARAFLLDPVGSLAVAGVVLSRPERKALVRAHRTVKEAATIAPGARITRLAVSASTRKRVDDPASGPPLRGRPGADCGCGSPGKG